MQSTKQINQTLQATEALQERKTLLNENLKKEEIPLSCADQLLACWGWIYKWHYLHGIIDSTKERIVIVKIEDETPDAAPAVTTLKP